MISIFREWLQKAKKHTLILLIVTVIIVFLGVSFIGGYLHQWDWTGFGTYIHPHDEKIDFQREKTLWDWMQLFIIPVVLAASGYLFSYIANRNAENSRQEETLRNYFDKLTEILLAKDVHDPVNTQARIAIRARTLNTLRMIDGDHKRHVLQFLAESNLINIDVIHGHGLDPILQYADLRCAKLHAIQLSKAKLHHIDFSQADLSNMCLNKAELFGCQLDQANLSHCHLEGAYLNGATLERADLRAADLTKADLSKRSIPDFYDAANLNHANLGTISFGDPSVFSVYRHTKLCHANLRGVTLKHANLTRADLSYADLSSTSLENANLQDANLSEADLSDADLTGACLKRANLNRATVTLEQLGKARSLRGATMPDGSLHDD